MKKLRPKWTSECLAIVTVDEQTLLEPFSRTSVTILAEARDSLYLKPDFNGIVRESRCTIHILKSRANVSFSISFLLPTFEDRKLIYAINRRRQWNYVSNSHHRTYKLHVRMIYCVQVPSEPCVPTSRGKLEQTWLRRIILGISLPLYWTRTCCIVLGLLKFHYYSKRFCVNQTCMSTLMHTSTFSSVKVLDRLRSLVSWTKILHLSTMWYWKWLETNNIEPSKPSHALLVVMHLKKTKHHNSVQGTVNYRPSPSMIFMHFQARISV